MRQRTAFVVAMGLTTFILVIAAAVIGRLAIAPPANGTVEIPALPTEQPTDQGLTEQQAAEYQQALQTASAQLERANRQLEEAYKRLTPAPEPAAPASVDSETPGVAPDVSPAPRASAASSPSPAPASDAPAPPSRITAEQAVATARAYVGGGIVERVRLEEEQGQLVYEVRFTDNSRVYIDPLSGRVIYARLEDRDRKDDTRSGKDD